MCKQLSEVTAPEVEVVVPLSRNFCTYCQCLSRGLVMALCSVRIDGADSKPNSDTKRDV